ncbi:MAG: hypothetical protein IJ588_04930 [Prevotella sp.]|nr:hypothetical protein [Prevotella sp.]
MAQTNYTKQQRQEVVRLHKAGWYSYNIASIAHISQALVEQILDKQGFIYNRPEAYDR